ncbi:MAG: diguanylate cyclase domain-containing protein [Alishewanella aestuarii]
MRDTVEIKLEWLNLPAAIVDEAASIRVRNQAFANLPEATQEALLQQVALIISNSDVHLSGYKSVNINLSSLQLFCADIVLQPDNCGFFAVIFYPLKYSSALTELYASVFEHSGEAIMITDAQDDIVAINQSFVANTGFAVNDILYRKPDFLRRGLNEEATLEQAWHSVNNYGHWSGEIKNRKANGEYYICWLSLSAVRSKADMVTHYVSIFSDITSHIHEHKKLKKMAYFDFLTGLPNRALLEDRFEQFVLHCQRLNNKISCVCIFIDVNDFKYINDTYGHKAGDDCLIAIAEALTSSIRQDDTACRFSGDEFVLLLHDIEHKEDIQRIVLQLEQKIALIAAKLAFDKTISVSIGVSNYPQDAAEFEQLISKADQAMYQEKRKYKQDR